LGAQWSLQQNEHSNSPFFTTYLSSVLIMSFCTQSLHAVELQQYRMTGSLFSRLKRYLHMVHLSFDSMLAAE
jgi:hypothetical protein